MTLEVCCILYSQSGCSKPKKNMKDAKRFPYVQLVVGAVAAAAKQCLVMFDQVWVLLRWLPEEVIGISRPDPMIRSRSQPEGAPKS